MGQNKKELRQLLTFIETLAKQPGNEDFVAGLRALLLSSSNNIDNVKLDEIYEYCIERNSHLQANGFYQNFTIPELIPELVETFALMESFKRRGDFLNFSAHIFKQIECIANYICMHDSYNSIFRSLCRIPSCILYNNDTPGSIFVRDQSSKPVYKLIFDEYDKTLDGKDKCSLPLHKQYIYEKVKIALYFGGYATSMTISKSKEYSKYSYDIYKLYLIRCEADHCGSTKSDKQDKIVKDILNNKEFYYTEFLKILFFFVDKLSNGYKLLDQLIDFSSSILTEENEGTISSALPGALYVKVGNSPAEEVPYSAYNRKIKYETGMPVIVSKKGGTIIKVSPK